MKRDMDLIRDILLRLEDCDDPQGMHSDQFDIPDRSDAEIGYHIKLLYEAGIINAKNNSTYGSPNKWHMINLNWHGHDFLEAARSDTVWQKAKEKAQAVGGMAFTTFVQVVLDMARRRAMGEDI